MMNTNKISCTANLRSYTTLASKTILKTGYPLLNSCGESHINAAFNSIDSYYRGLKAELAKSKKNTNLTVTESADINSTARDSI